MAVCGVGAGVYTCVQMPKAQGGSLYKYEGVRWLYFVAMSGAQIEDQVRLTIAIGSSLPFQVEVPLFVSVEDIVNGEIELTWDSDRNASLFPIVPAEFPSNVFNGQDMECTVCLEPIESIDATLLGCGHRYHTACLSKMPLDGRRCPLCRRETGFPAQTVLKRSLELEARVKALQLACEELQATNAALDAEVCRLKLVPTSEDLLAENKALWAKVRERSRLQINTESKHHLVGQCLDGIDEAVDQLAVAVEAAARV